MPVSAEIGTHINLQTSVFLGSKISPSFLVTAIYLTKFLTTVTWGALGSLEIFSHGSVAYTMSGCVIFSKKLRHPMDP